MTPLLLAPAALALSILLLGPILAHLARRRPQEDLAYGAMLLLRRVSQLKRRRHELQDLLLLLLRLLALLLVILAVARPELRWPGNADPALDHGPIVILLDNSLSMDLRPDPTLRPDQSLFTGARDRAAELIRELPTGHRVGLVTFGGEAQAIRSELTDDPSSLLGALGDIRQTAEATDLAGALREGRRLLGGSGGTLVVLSDGAGALAVPSARAELELLGRQRVALDPIPIRANLPKNLVIRSAEYGDGPEGGLVRVRVVNHGPAPEEVPLVVHLPDGTEITTFVEVPAAGEAEEVVTVPRTTSGGVATAALSDKHLPADDVFAFQLPRVGASRVLVVDGDPGLTAGTSEVYYLERALAPWGDGPADAARVLPEITSAAALPSLDPEVHRIVFLANLADPVPMLTRLTGFVQGGGAVVISLGDNVTADRYNDALSGLLPGRLLQVIRPPTTGGVATAIPNTEEELFRPFARGGADSFARARWTRFFGVQPFEGTRVLATTESGEPLLLERRVGRGRVLLFTGTLDLAWGDLCLQAAFMPFVQRLVAVLGGEAGVAGERLSGRVGEELSVSVGATPERPQVQGPGGAAPFRQASDQLLFRPDRPGAWQVKAGDGPPLAWVAVNTLPEESDVRPGPDLLAIAAEVDPERFLVREALSGPLLTAALLALAAQALAAALRRKPASTEASDGSD